MFLVLFGGVFSNPGQSKIDVVEVGKVGLIDDLPPKSRAAFDDAFKVSRSDDLSASVTKVRDGDETLAIEQHGRRIVSISARPTPLRPPPHRGRCSRSSSPRTSPRPASRPPSSTPPRESRTRP
jgi:hypothetical protein